MSWKIRHEGSPRSIEGLTVDQVVEGLQENQWEPTDEVMGPNDRDWVRIESHPQFEDVVMDLDPPLRREHEDETRLDMTPLIDVCLVLLIFFILTTSYAALQKMLEMPNLSSDNPDQLPTYTNKQVEQHMVRVALKMEDGKPVVRIEDQVVAPDDLLPALRRYVNQTKKTELLIDHDFDVPHGLVVAVQDAAKGAGMSGVMLLIPKEEIRK